MTADKARLKTSLAPECEAALRFYCAREGVSVAAAIRRAVEQFLEADHIWPAVRSGRVRAGTRTVSTKIPDSLRRALEETALRESTTLSAVVADALRNRCSLHVPKYPRP